MSPWNSAAVPHPTMTTTTTSCWQRKISLQSNWNGKTMTFKRRRRTTCPPYPYRACLDRRLRPRHQPTLTSNRNRNQNQLQNRLPRSRSHLAVLAHELGSEVAEVVVGVGSGLLHLLLLLVAGLAAAARPQPEPVSAPLLPLLLPSQQPRPRALTTPPFPLPRLRAAPRPPSTAPRRLMQGSVQPVSAADEAESELARTKLSSTRCAPNWQVRRCRVHLLQRRGPTRWLLLLLRWWRRVGRLRPLLKRLGTTLLLLLARNDPFSPRHQNHQAAPAPPPPRNPNSRNRNRSTLRGSPRPVRSG